MHHSLVTRYKEKVSRQFNYMLMLSVMIAGFMLLTIEPAMAQQSPMGNVVCCIIGIIYGNLGRGLAVLSVIVVGIGATLGKVSWGLAITVTVGIATVFGAVPLVAFLISGNAATPICNHCGVQ